METDIDKIQYTTPDSKKENRGLPNVGKKGSRTKKKLRLLRIPKSDVIL